MLETIYRIEGAEHAEFSRYESLIHWLWINADKYQVVKLTTDYTRDEMPSRKLLTYYTRKIQ